MNRWIVFLLTALFCVADLAAQRDTLLLNEATVKVRKERYRRKGNPTVELMQRVINAKDRNDWNAHHDYTSVEKYSKVTLSLNDVTTKMLSENGFRNMPFLREHVEVCNATGKLILPLTMSEMVTQKVWRRASETTKEIVLAERHKGLEEMVGVEDIAAAGIADLFTEVNIMDDDIRLLQRRITSPLSRRTAISFYHYYIIDTLAIDGMKLFEVGFSPANRQDFGFSGRMLIVDDSIPQVYHATLTLPRETGINWIESLSISQSFTTLPSGERVLTDDNMVLELHITSNFMKVQVQRTTHYSGHSTEVLADELFRPLGDRYSVGEANTRFPNYWHQHRTVPLSRGEQAIDNYRKNVLNMRGIKPLVWVLKAVATNSIPTNINPERPSKVDLTPVNTLISTNPINGLRLRLSARTTAHLLPHLFLKGYVAYGFKDHRWMGQGEVTYAFNRPEYTYTEFPVHNLTLSFQDDIMSPSDRYLNTDKDNIFTALKWTRSEKMMYFRTFRATYDHEWANGLRLTLKARREEDRPLLSASTSTPVLTYNTAQRFTTTDLTLGIQFRPGARFFNSKQSRHVLNGDAPLYSLTHTMGLRNVLGGQYTYHTTDAEIYRRLQLNSWGRLDIDIRGGILWNRVPYLLYLMPANNLSFIKQKNTFALINDMEFLHDRYASLMVGWDLSGKLFNRIPLLRRLKWREYLGVNALWGMQHQTPLDIDGNPMPVADASDPASRHWGYTLDKNRPYVEGIVGIHNILRILHVEYVHRFTYNNLPSATRHGIRLRINLSF